MSISIRLIFFFLTFGSLLQGQSRYPQDYFRVPMNIRPYLSGTFGEPRTTHFHAGLDIKTDQTTGVDIVAAADGYVSRIKISSFGYGKALYIQHPNGYTTVYGHLKSFGDSIQAYAERAHFKQQRFDIELFPNPGDLPVKKGEVVAYSGNTGGSGGPHLHFEIRDQNQRALNPLLFGLEITDRIKPYVGGMTLYDLSEHRFFHESVDQKLISNGQYLHPYADTLLVNTNQLGVSVFTYDQSNGSSNRNGVYQIRMQVDSQLVYAFTADEFGFDEDHYVCGHVDYAMRMRNSKISHNCFILPNNKYSGYDARVNEGKIPLSPDKSKEIIIDVSDFNGNLNRIRFFARQSMESTLFTDRKIYYSEVLPHDRYNTFKAEDVKVGFPIGSLYDTLHFNYAVELPNSSSVFSHYHYIHDPSTPPAGYYDIAIRTEGMTIPLLDKAILLRKDHRNRIRVEKGRIDGEYMVGRSKYFGMFYVGIDTIPPLVRGRNIYNGKDMRGQSQIRLTVSDNRTGIGDFDATIDGEWVLFEYEYKSDLLFYHFNDKIGPGEHKLVVTVTDEKDNKTIYETTFKR